jgi:4a-hydroxytetrahydrobiopterin dehydratase
MALLDGSEIEARLAGLDGWKREGEAIAREFDRGDFVGSVRFVESIVNPAEATHSEGGLTGADFDLAAKIDALA